MEKTGATRDGGAFWERMGNIACWNTVMDEDRYMIQALERVRRRPERQPTWHASGGGTRRLRIPAPQPSMIAPMPPASARPGCRSRRWCWCCCCSSACRWLVVLVVSFFDFDRIGIIPAFILDNYVELFTLGGDAAALSRARSSSR